MPRGTARGPPDMTSGQPWGSAWMHEAHRAEGATWTVGVLLGAGHDGRRDRELDVFRHRRTRLEPVAEARLGRLFLERRAAVEPADQVGGDPHAHRDRDR